ncbi:MAG TPA: Ni/Fe hydrogenase subunit alpha [Noviherbaspirillum sp.]|nr:Ni/Fe hydrogenase subunit alpha [Noviherbaspirillum sp.]
MISSLETAAQPDNLRRVAIEPVSRVEGHGKVTILLDDNNEVHQVRLHIVEFRGFEKFIEGRPYWEVPVMVQRLCGICPVSHNLAASKALDLIVGAKQITPAAEKLRRLMHYGQMLQSHALHLYHLCSPDLLFGFDSDVTLRNIVAVARQYPDAAKRGILLRKYGQEVIRITSGKRVHGTGSIPGGMNKSLSIEERNALKKDIDDIVAWGVESVKMVKDLHRQNPGLYDHFGTFRSGMMSLSGKDGALDFYDGTLRVRDDKGAILFDNVNYQQYETLIEEEVKPWSYMKFPYLKSIGPENGWYRVGPLSRIQNCDFIPTPLAEAERKEFVAYSEGPIHAPLAYHWTRMIELLHAAEVIRELLDDPDLLSQDLVVKGQRAHEGVGVIEAPRGTLFHHYQVDDNDLVTMCNLIVSTTNNNQAMNESIRTVARQYLNGKQITEGLLNHIEVAIRAFDPCLSCATHALGKMPLTAELVDVEGKLVHSLTRE